MKYIRFVNQYEKSCILETYCSIYLLNTNVLMKFCHLWKSLWPRRLMFESVPSVNTSGQQKCLGVYICQHTLLGYNFPNWQVFIIYTSQCTLKASFSTHILKNNLFHTTRKRGRTGKYTPEKLFTPKQHSLRF